MSIWQWVKRWWRQLLLGVLVVAAAGIGWRYYQAHEARAHIATLQKQQVAERPAQIRQYTKAYWGLTPKAVKITFPFNDKTLAHTVLTFKPADWAKAAWLKTTYLNGLTPVQPKKRTAENTQVSMNFYVMPQDGATFQYSTKLEMQLFTNQLLRTALWSTKAGPTTYLTASGRKSLHIATFFQPLSAAKTKQVLAHFTLLTAGTRETSGFRYAREQGLIGQSMTVTTTSKQVFKQPLSAIRRLIQTSALPNGATIDLWRADSADNISALRTFRVNEGQLKETQSPLPKKTNQQLLAKLMQRKRLYVNGLFNLAEGYGFAVDTLETIDVEGQKVDYFDGHAGWTIDEDGLTLDSGDGETDTEIYQVYKAANGHYRAIAYSNADGSGVATLIEFE